MMLDAEAVLQVHNPVAEILEALMDKHSLNQTDLANRSGVSQPAINRILNERSRAKKPRRETLEKNRRCAGRYPRTTDRTGPHFRTSLRQRGSPYWPLGNHDAQL